MAVALFAVTIDAAPVLVIAGFLGSHLYLVPMLGWLQRIGYQPFESTLPRNIGCPNELGRRLIERTARIAAQIGRRVTIIGHSKGGLLARGISASRPDLVSQMITLGSPFRGEMRAHPVTEGLLAMARQRVRPYVQPEFRDTCYTPQCQCDLVRAFRGEAPAAHRWRGVLAELPGRRV